MRRGRVLINTVAFVVCLLVGMGLAWSLSERYQDVGGPALEEDVNDMLLTASSLTIEKLDETPRRADGTPIALETATFALG